MLYIPERGGCLVVVEDAKREFSSGCYVPIPCYPLMAGLAVFGVPIMSGDGAPSRPRTRRRGMSQVEVHILVVYTRRHYPKLVQ